MGTITIHLLMVMMLYFTGISCAITVIGPVTTLDKVIYLIAVKMTHIPSSWIIISLIPLQFRKT